MPSFFLAIFSSCTFLRYLRDSSEPVQSRQVIFFSVRSLVLASSLASDAPLDFLMHRQEGDLCRRPHPQVIVLPVNLQLGGPLCGSWERRLCFELVGVAWILVGYPLLSKWFVPSPLQELQHLLWRRWRLIRSPTHVLSLHLRCQLALLPLFHLMALTEAFLRVSLPLFWWQPKPGSGQRRRQSRDTLQSMVDTHSFRKIQDVIVSCVSWHWQG